MKSKIQNEEQAFYHTTKTTKLTLSDNDIIETALSILKERIKLPESFITSPNDTINFLKLKMAELEHEVFSVLFLNNKHGVIECKEMFRGTIDGASVYPREVAKEALKLNASAVIFSHNHPSGNSSPSESDKIITKRLKEALDLFDIRVLDHIIIGADNTFSFAEEGLI